MTGWQLLAEVRARRPDLKVLLTTGYGRDSGPDGNAADENTRLLSKPFTGDALTGRCGRFLARGTSP